MKRFLGIAAVLCIATALHAQGSSPIMQWTQTVPSGACAPGVIPVVTSTGVIYSCQGGVWTAASTGGGNVPVITATWCSMAGVKCDGTTDDTAAVQAWLNSHCANAACNIAGNPGKTSLISSAAITMPNSGVAGGQGVFMQYPIVIDGQCPNANGTWGTIPTAGCFVLNMTYAPASGGKINTYAAGELTIKNTVIEDTGSDCGSYFLYTTNTTLNIPDDTFIGTGAGGTASCSNIALLGGTLATIGNDPNDAFQGYHTVFYHNFASKIRHFVDGQMYANQVNILYNTISADSGSSVAGDGFINITGASGAGQTDSGWNVVGNLLEGTNITYGIKLNAYAPNNYIAENGWWDSPASSYLVYLGASGNTGEIISCAQCGNKVIDPASPGFSGATSSYLALYPGSTVFGNAASAFAVANGSGAGCTAMTDVNLSVGTPAWTGTSTVVFPTDGTHNAGVVVCSTLQGAFYVYNFATNGTPASPQTASIAGAPKISIDQFGELNATNNVLINGGSNQVLRCTTAGTLPVGALTTVAANCGASTADGLYVK